MPFHHEAVAHGTGEYVRGMAHTNGLESFCSLMKRGYTGIYHKMSPKHLDRYVTEFAGRHNARGLDTREQMERLTKGMEGKRLRYQDPIKPNGFDSGAAFLRARSGIGGEVDIGNTPRNQRVVSVDYCSHLWIWCRTLLTSEGQKRRVSGANHICRALSTASRGENPMAGIKFKELVHFMIHECRENPMRLGSVRAQQGALVHGYARLSGDWSAPYRGALRQETDGSGSSGHTARAARTGA